MDRKTLALVSGGIDSVTALYLCDIEVEAVMFLHYGQRNTLVEYALAEHHAGVLDKEFILKDISQVFDGSRSSLLVMGDTEKNDWDVPNRNMNLISYATTYAQIHGFSSIITGIYVTDFGDTSERFVKSMELAVEEATQGRVTLVSPLFHMSKSDVVRTAHGLGIDFSKTHTCFVSDVAGVHCGECPACLNRKTAFKKENLEDNTKYLR